MAAAAFLQHDIVSAFSVKTDKVFNRQNKQVYAIVSKNVDLQIVSDVWFDQFDTQHQFRAVLQHVFDLFGDGEYCYWLTDFRFLRTDIDASKDWLVNQFMPAMFNAGLTRQAVVLPTEEGRSIYTATSDIVEKFGNDRIRSFIDIQAAKKWLLCDSLQ